MNICEKINGIREDNIRFKNMSHSILTSEDKSWIGKQIFENNMSRKKVIENYNLSENQVRSIAEKFVNGEKFHEKKGRPQAVDNKEKKKLLEVLQFCKKSQHTLTLD